MTVPNQRRDVPWVLTNHDERILRLEREPPGSCCQVPWIRLCQANSGLVVQGVDIDDEEPLSFSGTSSTVEGSDDPPYSDYFIQSSVNQITLLQHGIVEIMVELLWEDVFNAPSWLLLNDSIGFPTQIGMAYPTGYGQLGSTLAGKWRGRYPASTIFTVDVAQLSGVDRTVDDYYFEIHYVGDYDGTERVESNCWDQ